MASGRGIGRCHGALNDIISKNNPCARIRTTWISIKFWFYTHRAGTTEHHKYPGVPGLCHIVPEICGM